MKNFLEPNISLQSNNNHMGFNRNIQIQNNNNNDTPSKFRINNNLNNQYQNNVKKIK